MDRTSYRASRPSSNLPTVPRIVFLPGYKDKVGPTHFSCCSSYCSSWTKATTLLESILTYGNSICFIALLLVRLIDWLTNWLSLLFRVLYRQTVAINSCPILYIYLTAVGGVSKLFQFVDYALGDLHHSVHCWNALKLIMCIQFNKEYWTLTVSQPSLEGAVDVALNTSLGRADDINVLCWTAWTGTGAGGSDWETHKHYEL